VEGALDAPSAYQLTGSRFPVVAVSTAAAAESEVRNNLKWLDSFETIVLCLDNDKAGNEAAQKCARALPLGKVRIVKLQKGKDASDYLQDGISPAQFVDEWYKGEPWLPTGLVNAADLKEEWLNPPVEDIVEYPWALLQDHTRGIRKSEGEIDILHAPTGVGKTTVVDEIVYHIHQTHPNEKLGLLKLEESNRASLNGLLSI